MTSQQTKKVQYGINVGVAVNININIILSDYGLYTLLIKWCVWVCVCVLGVEVFSTVSHASAYRHTAGHTHTLQQSAAL